MGCSRDNKCFSLYTKVYPSAKESIDGSINTIKGELSDITTALEELYIPDDYLGSKVESQLQKICLNLKNDEALLAVLGGGINSFVNSKIQEHKQHYTNWKRIQDSIMAKKKEENMPNIKQFFDKFD
jgi:hypothetical protein